MSKSLWILLLLVTGVLALWRGTAGGVAFWNYQCQATPAPGEIQRIEVIQKKSKYALQLTYSYPFQGKTYTSKMLLAKPYHLNRASAELAAKNLTGMQWQVYLDPQSPEFSSLGSHFPFKEVFYGVCLIGVFLYFIYLKSYAAPT